MQDYRLYRLSPEGRIISAEVFAADNDEAAIEAVRGLKELMPCEIWQRGRRIAVVPPFGSLTAKNDPIADNSAL